MRTKIEQASSAGCASNDQEAPAETTVSENAAGQHKRSDSLVPFQFADRSIRTVYRESVVWFVAADVCDVLGIVNNRDALARLDTDEKSLLDVGED